MEVVVHSEDAAVIVNVSGEVDIGTSPRLRAELLEVIDRWGSDVVVDLADVSFMDSTGLGTLIACLKHARSRGVELRVRRASSAVERVFQVTGLNDVFSLDSLSGRRRRSG